VLADLAGCMLAYLTTGFADLHAVMWLEDYLRNYDNTVIIVCSRLLYSARPSLTTAALFRSHTHEASSTAFVPVSALPNLLDSSTQTHSLALLTRMPMLNCCHLTSSPGHFCVIQSCHI